MLVMSPWQENLLHMNQQKFHIRPLFPEVLMVKYLPLDGQINGQESSKKMPGNRACATLQLKD